MLKHIVMFKMKDTGEWEEAKNQNARMLKEKLDALPNKIPEIKAYEVGINFSTAGTAFDVVLISAFQHEEDLNNYRSHPDHEKVLDFIKQSVEKTAVVDYWDE